MQSPAKGWKKICKQKFKDSAVKSVYALQIFHWFTKKLNYFCQEPVEVDRMGQC